MEWYFRRLYVERGQVGQETTEILESTETHTGSPETKTRTCRFLGTGPVSGRTGGPDGKCTTRKRISVRARRGIFYTEVGRPGLSLK